MPFLKIPISFTPLIPCLLPPRDEREKTERTTAQLPANKKCCLLIFAIAIGCLVLAAIPARNPHLSSSIIPKIFGISLCPATYYAFANGLANNLVPRLLLCSRGSARNLILTPTPKHPKYSFFPCSIQKFSLSLRPILKDTNETRTFTSQSNVRPRDCSGIVGA